MTERKNKQMNYFDKIKRHNTCENCTRKNCRKVCERLTMI